MEAGAARRLVTQQQALAPHLLALHLLALHLLPVGEGRGAGVARALDTARGGWWVFFYTPIWGYFFLLADCSNTPRAWSFTLQVFCSTLRGCCAGGQEEEEEEVETGHCCHPHPELATGYWQIQPCYPTKSPRLQTCFLSDKPWESSSKWPVQKGKLLFNEGGLILNRPIHTHSYHPYHDSALARTENSCRFGICGKPNKDIFQALWQLIGKF